jgi:hypothetical protein
MSLTAFLNELLTDGRVRVGVAGDVAEPDRLEAEQNLANVERQSRLDLPGEPPPLSAPAAIWAATTFREACRFVAFRDLDPVAMGVLAQRPNLSADPPSIHYSVDLTFRFLPDVICQARTASEQDPLVAHLLQLAREWPLSSVGIAGVADVNVDAVVGHPCLLRMYADRIIVARDWTRLSSPRVREAVQCAVGLFPELAPEFPAEAAT